LVEPQAPTAIGVGMHVTSWTIGWVRRPTGPPAPGPPKRDRRGGRRQY